MDSKEYASVIRKAAEIGGPCLLCEQWTHQVGIFAPSNKSLFGTPIGNRTRTAIYLLCEKCLEKKRVFEKVERQLIKNAEIGGMWLVAEKHDN